MYRIDMLSSMEDTEIKSKDIVLVDINELKPWDKNPNKHSQEQIGRLADIIKYQGFRQPIVVSKLDGVVVAGHGRLEASKKLGLKKVPVMYQEFDSEDQQYAFMVSDNSISSWAELDLSSINLELENLGPDFNIDLLGIKDFVLDMSEKLEPGCGEDEIPEHIESRTKSGDKYELGNHRLLCGDSTKDIYKICSDIDIVITSPPYNAGSGDRGGLKDKKGFYRTDSDNKSSDEYRIMVVKVLEQITKVSKEDANIFWNLNYNANDRSNYVKFLNDSSQNFELIETIIWNKKRGMPNMGLSRVWEFVFWLTKKRASLFSSSGLLNRKDFYQNENTTNMIEASDSIQDSEVKHHATYPVSFVESIFRFDDRKAVLDPFGGCGTTMIACEKTNRTCYSVELDPYYCDLIVARWEKYTGKKAVLISDQDSDTGPKDTPQNQV